MSSPNNDDEIRRAQLQMQFHSTRREDFETVETFVENLKSIANSLAEMNSQISDSDMLLQLFAGSPDLYNPLRQTITSRSPLPNFDEACSLLYMQEDMLLQEQSTSDPDVGDPKKSSAFFTKDKFYTVMDTLGTFAPVVGTVTTAYGAVGASRMIAVGAVGAVGASRMIAVGAVGGITAMCSSFYHRESTMSFPSEKSIDLDSNDEPIIIAQQLKMQFHSTRKGDGETIDTYLKNLKSIADSLSANENPVSDPDLVLQLVAGLPSPQYSPYQSRISSQYPLPDFSDACSLLYMYESLLQASCTGSDNSDLEEENDNSNIEKFGKIVGVFNSVSNVVITACDVWSMFTTSSTTNTMGNKNFTRRRNRRRGRK